MTFCSPIFKSKGAIPIEPNAAPLAVLTFNGFLIRLIFSAIFCNTCYKIHEHVAPVLNRAVIGSVLRILTEKIDNLSFSYSKFEIM